MTIDTITLPQWNDDGVHFISCKIILEAMNDATITLYNASVYQGMVYNMIENVNPKLAYVLHENGTVKPWTFSVLQFPFNKTNEKGNYTIQKGLRGSWVIATTRKAIMDAIMQSSTQGKVLNFGILALRIVTIEMHDGSRVGCPDGITSIIIHLDTPTLLRDLKTGKDRPMTAETLLVAVKRKIKQLGVITDMDVNALLPFVRVLRDDTRNSAMFVTKIVKRDGVVTQRGRIGYVTLKLVGSDDVKMTVWELLNAMQYTGIGSQTSLGFGHVTITCKC